jgi:Yippee zinc-binding/DNA-binding /Mis18, centromere assembly
MDSSPPGRSPVMMMMMAMPGSSPRSSPFAGGRNQLLSNNNNDAANKAKAQSRDAQKINDAMVYLDGPQVYTCAQCRTHLTSHDDIISKSFHGKHGRAYLFDQCVNVTIGRSENRLLMTGLHSVSDIFCKRCKDCVGWTYIQAFEASQKYKEGKFIIEKIYLHLEESDYYDAAPPAGERSDRWRKRSMSWGSECSSSAGAGAGLNLIYEYRPSSPSQET